MAMDFQAFLNLGNASSQPIIGQYDFFILFCHMVMVLLRFAVIFFGLALLVNLYTRAMTFERDYMPSDPE